MKLFRIVPLVFVILFSASAFAAENAETVAEGTASQQEQTAASHNFELIIQHATKDEDMSWEAEIFSLSAGSSAGKISSQQPAATLEKGNYLFVLHFEENVPEIPEKKPFTFSIADNTKTSFKLTIGASQEPEMERGVNRTGADFVESDSRQGRDYVNFKLAKGQAEECLARCKKDRNCDAYSYVDHPDWATYSRCWLIHGAAVAREDAYSVSGRIQREESPYLVEITSTPSGTAR